MSETKHPPAVNAEVDYERHDVSVFYIAMVGVLLVIAAVIIHAAVWRLFERFERGMAQQKGQNVSLIRREPQPPPEPRLQLNPAGDLQQMRAASDAVLNNYRWIDRQHGVVGIPIERAMSLIAERGLPTFQPNAKPDSSAAKKNGENAAHRSDEQSRGGR